MQYLSNYAWFLFSNEIQHHKVSAMTFLHYGLIIVFIHAWLPCIGNNTIQRCHNSPTSMVGGCWYNKEFEFELVDLPTVYILSYWVLYDDSGVVKQKSNPVH